MPARDPWTLGTSANRPTRPLPTTAALARGAKTRPFRDLSSVLLGALHGATGVAFSSRPGVPLAQAIAARSAGRPLPSLPIARGTSPEAFEQARPVGQAIASVPLAGGFVRATARRAAALAGAERALTPAAQTPAAQKLVAAIRAAKPIRAEQEALYSAERSRRLGKALAAGEKAPGEAGARRALGSLKGELPKAKFEPVRPLFSQTEVDELFDAVKSNPLLPGYSRISAISGLTKLLHPAGVGVPQANELQLLSRVFGQEFVREVTRNQGAVPWLIEALGIPRAIKATLDLSAPLRQGLVAGVRYPKQFVRAFSDMFRAAAREESYQALKQGIVSRPTFRLMDEAKLALTGLDEGTLLAREEQFISRLPEAIPVFGRVVRASNRAYTGFLMKLRADVFDELLKRSSSAGVPQTEELFAGIAKFVNAATGRGDLGALSRAGSQLSTALFSPRLLASRVNLLDIRGLPGVRNVTGGGFYMSLPPFVRKEALKSMLSLAAFGGTVLGLAGLAGARVGKDARSADFGKIIVGNTRTDIWGGFQQYPRIAFQLAKGELVSTTTGKTIKLGEGFRPLTRKDIALRFFESKANPLIGAILEVLEGRTFEGTKPTLPSTARRLLTPLLAEDLYDIAKDDPTLLPLIIPGIFGAGVQTYGPRRGAKSPDPWKLSGP